MIQKNLNSNDVAKALKTAREAGSNAYAIELPAAGNGQCFQRIRPSKAYIGSGQGELSRMIREGNQIRSPKHHGQ